MDNNNMTIRIITEEAKEIEASVITLFEITETNNKYAIYTFNEEDAQGLVKIYASKISEIDGLYNFVSIADADEWNSIKAIMKYMAKEDNGDDGTDGGKIKLLSAAKIKSQMNEPISVKLSETKAAKIGPNYKSGITNTYLKNVKDEVEIPTPSVEVTPEPATIPNVEIDPQPEIAIATPEVEISTPEVEPAPIEIPQVQPVSQEEDNSSNFELPKVEEAPAVDIPVAPSFEIPQVEEPKSFEMPEVPSFNPEPINNTNDEEYETSKTYDKEDDQKPMYSFDMPSLDDKDDEESQSYDDVPKYEEEREIPSVDSVLNKASYYNNIPEEKEEKNESNENIIQSIGLEFMKKVSELAEYEKDLNKRNKELEGKEKLLNRLEKDLAEKEDKQKSAMQSNKDKEMELRRIEKDLADRDNDLNRRIMEFNKKISMFQQTFETISKVD